MLFLYITVEQLRRRFRLRPLQVDKVRDVAYCCSKWLEIMFCGCHRIFVTFECWFTWNGYSLDCLQTIPSSDVVGFIVYSSRASIFIFLITFLRILHIFFAIVYFFHIAIHFLFVNSWSSMNNLSLIDHPIRKRYFLSSLF